MATAPDDVLATRPLLLCLVDGIRFANGRDLPKDSLSVIKKFAWPTHPLAAIMKKLRFLHPSDDRLRVSGDELLPARWIRLSGKSSDPCYWREHTHIDAHTMYCRYKDKDGGEPSGSIEFRKMTLMEIREKAIQFRIMLEDRNPNVDHDILELTYPSRLMPEICWRCEWFPCACF